MSMRKIETCIVTSAMLTLALGWFPSAAKIPAPEHTFYGTATVDGAPLFAGTILATRRPSTAAECPADCLPGACTMTTLAGFDVPLNPPVDYVYVLRVPIDTVAPITPGMAVEGEPVCFYINGRLAGDDRLGRRGETTRYDLDPVLQTGLSIDDVAIFEGNTGSSLAIFTVTVEPPAVSDIIVEYRTEDGTATSVDADYASLTENRIVAASPASPLSSFTIRIDVIGDAAEEADETFLVRLVDVTNARIRDAVGQGLIRDDDGPGRLMLAPSSVGEGNVDARFDVTLTRALEVAASTAYQTQPGVGTATAGLDYLPTLGRVTIPAGQTSATISVPILADARAEPDETFFVELWNPINAIVDPAAAVGVGTIRDDERFLDWIEAERDGVSGVEGLKTAVSVTVAADGRNVYVAGQFDNAISIFDRAADDAADAGELSFLDVVEDETGSGFIELLGVAALAVSPDNDYLYAASSASSAVAVFDRSPFTGLLAITDVVKDGVDNVTGIAGASALAFSPGTAARQLYVASSSAKSLVVFDRDELSGALSHVQTLREGQGGVDGLAGVSGVSVSPDGAHVYTASYLENGVARFERDGLTGRLEFVDVLRAGGRDALGRVVHGILGAHGVAISPDGRHLYVTGRDDHALAAFRRETDQASAEFGALTFLESETQAVRSVDGLDGASAVTVSLDGKFVYVTGFQADAVAVFARNTDPMSSDHGTLEFVESRRNDEPDVSGVGRPTWIAVGPGDREVYVTGSIDDAIAVFARDFDSPSNPDLSSVEFSHTVAVWNNDRTIEASWPGAEDDDGGAGVRGYSYEFIPLLSGRVLDEFVDVEHGDDPQTITSVALPDGAYGFHLTTCDRGANCAEELIVRGPFLIDGTAPRDPVITGTSQVLDVVTVTWTAALDGVGSGLAGYTGCFDSAADTDCSACPGATYFDVVTGGPELAPGTTSATSPPLPNELWFFHLCPYDAAGNVGATLHVPLVVDICHDADSDGFGAQPNTSCPNAGTDCADDDPNITVARPFYEDRDGDGFGDAAVTRSGCEPDPGFVADGSDCDDSDPDVRPGRLEECENGIDDNCDAVLDALDESCLSGCAGSVRELPVIWNFTGPRVDVGLSAVELCERLLDVDAPSSPAIERYLDDSWVSHRCGTPGDSFAIEVGSGYFVRSQLPTRWCEDGSEVTFPLIVNLDQGWNALSLPGWAEGAHSASSACAAINAQGGAAEEIDRYTAGGWEGHVCELPFNDFPLAAGEGYFVRSATESTWVVDAPQPSLAPDGEVLSKSLPESSESSRREAMRRDRLLHSRPSPPGMLCERQVANVGDQTFTVVWGGDRPSTGYVAYGTTRDRLTRRACNVGDASHPDCTAASLTHFVRVDGLRPDATYWVQVISAGRAIGEPFEVTTGPTLAVPPSDTTYGSLLQAGSPVATAYVCATLDDADGIGTPGSSARVCDLVDAEDAGYWSINLGHVRTADFQQRYSYSIEGDRIEQHICAATLGCASAGIDTGADAPAPVIELTESCATKPDPAPSGSRKTDGDVRRRPVNADEGR